ncbi:MAG: RnfABCDGE type electron transport complex subunit D [Thermoplasmata archaeon]
MTEATAVAPRLAYGARARSLFARWLPPARFLWILLLAIGVYGVQFFGEGTGLTSILFLPLVAAVVDVTFQTLRFPAVRLPDAAIATGLFLALILPPTAPLPLAACAAAGAILLRHLLRFRGHPVFNPAVTGALLGFLFLGLAPAWWVAVGPTVGVGSVGEFVMILLGGLLLLRNLRSWRLPVAFFFAYGFIAIVQHLLVGTSTDPRVLLLQAIDPVMVFFGLFMITEPRTAPSQIRFQTLYAGTVGVMAALLPSFFPSIGLFLALLGGNLIALGVRRSAAETRPESSRLRSQDRRGARAVPPRARAPAPGPGRWSVGRRVTAGVAGILAIAIVASVVGVGHTSAPLFQVTGPGGGGGSSAACTKDNPAIPASTLSTLHRLLGPSIILSYDSSTGVVVFYDPVNQVTVTETDLYEDYGYAEFNGDDYAVSGCSG